MSPASSNHILRKINLPEGPACANGPLKGLRYSVKDIFLIKGEPVSYGLKPPLVDKSPFHAELIDHLSDLGAKLTAVCNLDPAAISISGKNPYYGDMKHPHNETLPLGGSSGGCAITVVKGEVDFSVGSDHGGSIRIPAATCNLNGLVLSAGALPEAGCILLENEIDRIGILSKDLKELLLIASKAIDPKILTSADFQDILVIPNDEELKLCTEQQLHSFNNYLEGLSKKFTIRKSTKNLGFQEALNARKIIVSHYFLELINQHEYELAGLPDDAKAVCLFAKQFSEQQITDAKNIATKLTENLAAIFNEGALILTPTLPFQAAELEKGINIANYFLCLANVIGSPALNIAASLPLQLIGQKGAELVLLTAAQRF